LLTDPRPWARWKITGADGCDPVTKPIANTEIIDGETAPRTPEGGSNERIEFKQKKISSTRWEKRKILKVSLPPGRGIKTGNGKKHKRLFRERGT